MLTETLICRPSTAAALRVSTSSPSQDFRVLLEKALPHSCTTSVSLPLDQESSLAAPLAYGISSSTRTPPPLPVAPFPFHAMPKTNGLHQACEGTAMVGTFPCCSMMSSVALSGPTASYFFHWVFCQPSTDPSTAPHCPQNKAEWSQARQNSPITPNHHLTPHLDLQNHVICRA